MTHIHFKSNILLLLLLLFSATASAQSNRQLSVASFSLDQLDLTAKNEQYKKVDGNGSLYAIIKVSSTAANDNLKEYRFNFGNLSHEVVEHDGKLWVYVQRNAKHVTISRQGFSTIDKYDLGSTIEAGRTYIMRLSPKLASLQTQMVMFNIAPASEKPVITIKGAQAGAVEEMLDVDMIDESGAVAKNLPLGSYTYKVMCVGYYPSEGQFTLSDKKITHVEQVVLRPRFAETTLTVDADADIYVNGELKGKRTWKGRLNAGEYNIECRQLNHRSTMQRITVSENAASSFTLASPTPITGSLSIITNPLKAKVLVDGKSYGFTPQNISDLLVGQHRITLSKEGYNDEVIDITITENEMADVNRKLTRGNATLSQQTIASVETVNMNDKNTLTLKTSVSKLNNKRKLLKIIGIGGGLAVVGVGGLIMLTAPSDKGYEEQMIEGGVVMGCGVLGATLCMIKAHNYKRKADRIQASLVYQYDFRLTNGSTLSASIDMLKDGVNNRQTLGLGLQCSF